MPDGFSRVWILLPWFRARLPGFRPAEFGLPSTSGNDNDNEENDEDEDEDDGRWTMDDEE